MGVLRWNESSSPVNRMDNSSNNNIPVSAMQRKSMEVRPALVLNVNVESLYTVQICECETIHITNWGLPSFEPPAFLLRHLPLYARQEEIGRQLFFIAKKRPISVSLFYFFRLQYLHSNGLTLKFVIIFVLPIGIGYRHGATHVRYLVHTVPILTH